jgi:hypothetical protein
MWRIFSFARKLFAFHGKIGCRFAASGVSFASVIGAGRGERIEQNQAKLLRSTTISSGENEHNHTLTAKCKRINAR